jgi:thiopeptide-type bacteriocin biosynthesis protein
MTAPKPGKPAHADGAPHLSQARPAYDPLDFVVVRAPMLPVEFYHAVSQHSFDDPELGEFVGNQRVLSAIRAASPVLVSALLSATKNASDRARAKRKLRRYLIRMSTRPTPFGALAGVAIAPLGERTTLRLDESAAGHFPHLDVPWLLGFVHRLESDWEIFRQLNLLANPCIFQRGGRIYIRELNPLFSNSNTVRNASLNASKMVTRALEAARKPIPYETLSMRLGGSPNASEEKIRRFVTELWRQEFLLTELRPPFTTGDPVRYLLQRLQGLRGAEPYRLELDHRLAAAKEILNAQSPADECQESEDGRNPRVHITSVLPVRGQLNVAVAKEAARAAELLLSVTPCPSGLPHIVTYRQAFEERYGTEREVPLLEMIDAEYGIGVPSAYEGKKNSPGIEQPAQQRLRRETLFDIAQAANEERRIEVELDEKTLRHLRTWEPSAQAMPVSLEIFAFVAASSARDLDEGRFSLVVGPNVGAMEAGRSLGRFVEFLGPVGMEAYQSAALAHEAAIPAKQCVELNYLPRKLALTNILARPARRGWEINVGVHPGASSNQVIPVSDLVVGVHGSRFYVKCLQLNRVLDIRSGHMANIDFAPAVCRVLVELMYDGTAILRDFDWGAASMHHFLPRVRVGRVVLSVAKWRISESVLHRHLHRDSLAAFRGSLTRWRTEWNVPRHVYFAQADNRLLLDLENDLDIEDFFAEVRKVSEKYAIILEEVYPGVGEAWLPGPSGSYIAEYAVPLVIHQPTEPARGVRANAAETFSAMQETTAARRVKTPGSDWLYIKLYTPPSLVDDLLSVPIGEMAGWARASGTCQRWFFVRYADPQPHIRLRFQGAPATLSGSLFPRLLVWAQDLVRTDVCLRFAIDTYEPEIERYGGIEAIDLAEELFALDSELTLALLRFLDPQGLRRVELAVFGLNFLFEKLGWSLEDRRELFKGIAAPRMESGDEYRERKAVLQALVGWDDDLLLDKSVKEMARALEPVAAAIEDVGWRLRTLDQDGRLAPPLHFICRSFAHMHCNRLGLNGATERLAYGLLTRSYDALQARSRKSMDARQAAGPTGHKERG